MPAARPHAVGLALQQRTSLCALDSSRQGTATGRKQSEPPHALPEAALRREVQTFVFCVACFEANDRRLAKPSQALARTAALLEEYVECVAAQKPSSACPAVVQ